MLTLSRRHALLFRTVLKNSLLDQPPPRDWPLVVCQGSPEGLSLRAQKGDIAVGLDLPGPQEPDTLVFRATVLAELEARNDQPVTLEVTGPGRAQARWHEGVVARAWDFDTVTPDSVPPWAPEPKELNPAPESFRQALTVASLATAQDNTRFALAKLQLSGRDGQVVATDGKQLLLQGGFHFPWSDIILVPRLGALTRKNLLPPEPLFLGRTEQDLVLRLGPWRFLLRIDTQSRFPNTRGVIPSLRGITSTLVLQRGDAELLAEALRELPAQDDTNRAVTLDLTAPVMVRARAEGSDHLTEVELPTARVEGRPTRLSVNRMYLLRALELGFTRLEITRPDQPLVCRDETRTYVWLPLDPKTILAPAHERNSSPSQPLALTTTLPSERRDAMPLANGRPEADRPNGTSPPGPPLSLEALLTEAEELRALVHETGGRLTRLTAGLKQLRRHNRVFEQALTSLRQLNLDRGP